VVDGAGVVVAPPEFAISSICCCWRARSISGPAMKYCQPISTAIDSAIAIRKFLLSIISRTCLRHFRPAPMRSDPSLDRQ
jgi:hypothetical protein